MKRVLLAMLAFLGIACITAAIAIPLWLVPQLRVVPLDLDITSNATTVAADGSPGERYPATIFDRCSISEKKARTLSAHLTQQRRSIIVDPSNRRQATLQSAQTVQIDGTRTADGEETKPSAPTSTGELKCDDGLLTATIDRVSVNRNTSVPNGAVSSLQLEAAPEGGDVKDVSVPLNNRKGFQYKFPFDTKKKSYYYYDLNTRQDTVANFVGEQTIDGVKTYHFETQVPETDLSSLPNPQGNAALGTMLSMPAKWWGISGRGVKPNDTVEMHRYAAATRHVWVEPETGTIVDGREDQHQYFRSPNKDDEDTAAPIRNFQLDALKATFQWDDATVSGQAKKAEHYMGLLKLGRLWLPLILGIVGVVLVALWLILALRGRKRNDGQRPDEADDDDTVVTDSPANLGEGAALAGGAHTAATTVIPAAEDASQDSEQQQGGAYLWDSPTQRIPKVDEPTTTLDPLQDFQPHGDNDDSAGDDTDVYRRPE